MRRRPVYGSKAGSFGTYELRATAAWLSPVVLTMLATFLVSQVVPWLSDMGGWAEIIGGAIALAAKALQLWLANNMNKQQ